MSWGSTVPAALTGLVDGFKVGLPTTDVIKGSVVGNSTRTEAVIVGYTGESGLSPAVQMHMAPGDVANRSQNEQYLVSCQVAVLIASTNVEKGIDRAFEIFSAVGETFRTDQTLNIPGTRARARLGDWNFSLVQTPKGLAAQIDFAVDVSAFTLQ